MISNTDQPKRLHELLSLLTNSLASLSDAKHQERIWVQNEGDEIYEDVYEHLIKNSSAIFELSLAPKYLGKRLYSRLRELYDRLEAYNIKITRDPYYECYPCCQILINVSLEYMLNDPEWHLIQQKAKVLHDDLKIKEKLLLKIVNTPGQHD